MFVWLLDLLFPIRTDEAIVRELTTLTFLSRLEPHLEERVSPPAVVLLPFADRSVRAVIHEAKYHGSEKAFALLAAALTEYLRDDDRLGGLTHAVLVPIPLGREREQKRGFNQAREVAKLVGKELTIPLQANLIVRTRETVTQVSLSRRARLKNMQGVFSATQTLNPETLYILIDDVTTTGATLSAAIEALRDAGAEEILPIALAH